MLPVGLLAIIALGLVVAYVLPQRIKERSEYGLVRVDDRYSSDMRVVKSTAERMERAHARASTNSGEVPLLRTGESVPRRSAIASHLRYAQSQCRDLRAPWTVPRCTRSANSLRCALIGLRYLPSAQSRLAVAGWSHLPRSRS